MPKEPGSFLFERFEQEKRTVLAQLFPKFFRFIETEKKREESQRERRGSREAGRRESREKK